MSSTTGITKVFTSDNMGKTASMVDLDSGYLYLNSAIWPNLDRNTRYFCLHHESGHVLNNTMDEFIADEHAFNQYLSNGKELTDCLKALQNVLHFQKQQDIDRMKRMSELIQLHSNQNQNDMRKFANADGDQPTEGGSNIAGTIKDNTSTNQNGDINFMGVNISKGFRDKLSQINANITALFGLGSKGSAWSKMSDQEKSDVIDLLIPLSFSQAGVDPQLIFITEMTKLGEPFWDSFSAKNKWAVDRIAAFEKKYGLHFNGANATTPEGIKKINEEEAKAKNEFSSKSTMSKGVQKITEKVKETSNYNLVAIFLGFVAICTTAYILIRKK